MERLELIADTYLSMATPVQCGGYNLDTSTISIRMAYWYSAR